MATDKLSRKKLQEAIGCSMRTIRLAILNGRITGTKNGQGHWEFDLEACRAALRATSTAHRLPGAHEIGVPPEESAKGSGKPKKDNGRTVKDEDEEDAGDAPGTIAEARLKFETFRAKSEELDYRKAAGELIPLDEVKRAFEDIAIKVQRGVLAVPPRISAIAAAETDEFKINALFTNELKIALRSISDGLKLSIT